MRRIEPVLLVVFALVLVLIVYSMIKKPVSNIPMQTSTTAEENLNSELNSLDATDLDSGVNSQLEQLSSDSSSF